jgi:dihydroneopterin aldolase
MKLEDSYIDLTGMRFHAYHGVLEQERVVGNDYSVDVRVKYDVGRAMLSDDVNDTLNYATIYELIRQEMSVPSNLLERVAYRIGERLVGHFPAIEQVDVRLTKRNPPMGADCDGATVELHLKP